MVLSKKAIYMVAAGALMFAQSVASRAVTFTLRVPSGVSSPASTFVTGVRSDSNTYLASLIPSGTTTFFNQSTVSYGITQIGGGGPDSRDTFTNRPASFTFDVSANGVTRQFIVSGVITDIAGGTSIGPGFTASSSGDDFVAQSIRVAGGFTYTNVVASPNQRLSVLANGIQFGSTFADIYVEQLNGLTSPLDSNNLSVGGYIGNAVPEPGSVALLVGISMTGAGLLARRKRGVKN